MAPSSVQSNRRAFLKVSAVTVLSMAGLFRLGREFLLSHVDLYSLSEAVLPSDLNPAERKRAVEGFLNWKKNAPDRLDHPDWRDMQSVKFRALLSYRQPFSSLSLERKKQVIHQSLSRNKNRWHLVFRFSRYFFRSTDGINLIHNLRVDAFSPRPLSESRYLPRKLS